MHWECMMHEPRWAKQFFSSLSLFNLPLCRLRDCNSESDTSSKRYIITAPPSDFLLLPSDMVFVLMQFDQGTEYRPLIDGIMLT